MPISISRFDAVTFDVYGTLIDWEPSIVAFLRKWADGHGVEASDVDLIMAFDRARADIQKERPAHLYPEVLRRCFSRISGEFGVPVDAGVAEEFSRAPHLWPAFDDSGEGLRALQAKVKIGALSNIDNASLASSCRKLGIDFDLKVTAEIVGAYKPDFAHFRTAIEKLKLEGISPERILHVGQSLRADVTPANKLGLTCVWIDRPDRLLGLYGEGAAEAKPDLKFTNMADFVAAIL